MSRFGLFTPMGRLLVMVVEKPGITAKELASNLFLTKRSVYGMTGKLRGVGYLEVTTGELILGSGRPTHHYFVSSFGLAELRKLTEGKRRGSSP